MSDRTLGDAAFLRSFQAVAEETRFEIVRRLSDGERCVCELQHDLDAAQSRLSFHLRKLKEAEVVSEAIDTEAGSGAGGPRSAVTGREAPAPTLANGITRLDSKTAWEEV